MQGSNLYPEPPHLTIAVYPDISDSECFSAACSVLDEVGCRPGGAVEVAPWDLKFELRSDLVGRSSLLDLPPDQFKHVVTGNDRSARPVRASYLAGQGGVVLVEYLAAPFDDRHPIGVTISAGALGYPVETWGRSEHGSAAKLVRWALEVLEGITTECRVAYGAVGVEYSLATPSELASHAAALPSEVFLSRRVATDIPQTREVLARDFRDGVVIEWPSGWFFSGWGPFNSEKISLPLSLISPVKASGQLGRILLNR